MVTIKNNKITMTRGDSLNVKVMVVRSKSKEGINNKTIPDSREIVKEFPAGTVIKFAMSRFFPGQVKYKLLLTKEIPTSTLALILDSDDTKNIPIGIYNYDIKIITPSENPQESDKVDTFIQGTIQLVGECEGEEGVVNDYIHADGVPDYTTDDSEYDEGEDIE